MRDAEIPAASPLSKQRLRLWLRLLHAQRVVESDLRERLRDAWDSTLPRFDLMAALARRPEGMRMSDLSKMLKVSNGNVTGLVDRLAAEGHVERKAVEGDRRASLVRLTDRGRAGFDAMARDHEAWVDEIFAGFDADELERMIALLGRVWEGKA